MAELKLGEIVRSAQRRRTLSSTSGSLPSEAGDRRRHSANLKSLDLLVVSPFASLRAGSRPAGSADTRQHSFNLKPLDLLL